MANSILPVDDDKSCDAYSNSTYNSFWSIEAFRKWQYSPNWSVGTVCSCSSFTSNWSVDTVSSIDSLCSTDTITSRDHLICSPYSSIWSITSLEGDWESDVVFEDPEKTEEGFDDVNSNLSDDPSIPTTTKKQNVFKRIGKSLKRLLTWNRRSNKVFPFPI